MRECRDETRFSVLMSGGDPGEVFRRSRHGNGRGWAGFITSATCGPFVLESL